MQTFHSSLRLDRFKKGNKFAFGKGQGKGAKPPTEEEKDLAKNPAEMAQLKAKIDALKKSGKGFSSEYFGLLNKYNKAKAL